MKTINEIYRMTKDSILDSELSLEEDVLTPIKEEVDRLSSIAKKSSKKELLSVTNFEIFKLFMQLANYDLPYYDELEYVLEDNKSIINSWTYDKDGKTLITISNGIVREDKVTDSLMKKIISLNVTSDLLQFHLGMSFYAISIFLKYKRETEYLLKKTGNTLSKDIQSKVEKKAYTNSQMPNLIEAAITCIKEEIKSYQVKKENTQNKIKYSKELLELIEEGNLSKLLNVPDMWHKYLDTKILEELYDIVHHNLLSSYKELEKEEQQLNDEINENELKRYLIREKLDYNSLPIDIINKLIAIPNIVERIKRFKLFNIPIGNIILKYTSCLIDFEEEKIKFIESLIKIGALNSNTVITKLDEIIGKYSLIFTNYQILKDIIDFNNMFYQDSILFIDYHQLRNIISVLKEYNLTKNNYMFLLCNYEYLYIYDLMLEHDIREELLISICHTDNPLNTIKRIIVYKGIKEPYLTGNLHLRKEVTSGNKLDNNLDDYIDNIIPYILLNPIKGNKIDTVIDQDIVKYLDNKYRQGDVYIFGTTKISRAKFLKNYQKSNNPQDIINCLISNSILDATSYSSIRLEIENKNLLTK